MHEYDLDTIHPERIDLIADSLQSGRFPKGKFYLAQIVNGVTTHCCLGVACRVYQDTGRELAVSESNNTLRFGEEVSYLPRVVRDWCGFTSKNPHLPIEIEDTIVWLYAADINDEGPGFLSSGGTHVRGYNPEDTFATTIVPAFRRLAQMARDYQAEHVIVL